MVSLLKNTKCFLNFCHTLLFHSIFAGEYSILSSLLTFRRLIVPQQPWIKPFYHINTNEIPGDLSRENMISSHVKITCYLHLWKGNRCYGYIINGAFHTKKLLKRNGLVFRWCLYNKQNITWPLGDTKFLFSCWKNISLVRCAHSSNIVQHSKRNFVSPRGHVISSMN